MKLILASQSPRRRELLSMITKDFTVAVPGADETILPGTPPREAVEQLAVVKARAVAGGLTGDWCVIGADTIVAVDGDMLGKPRSRDECVAMLTRLSGRAHTVCTGVAVLTAKGDRQVFCEETAVEFFPLSREEILWYAATDEPYDKAGAYGIQGLGAVLIKGIRGDFFTVMGLPVARLSRVLSGFGVPVFAPPPKG